MEFTGYMDFWFTDRPLIERVEPFAKLGVKRLDVWCWRLIDVAGIAEECKRHDSILNSTFDHDMGSLADPADNEKTLRTWAETLEMAERYNVEHLFIFSNQIDIIDGKEWSKRLSGNYSEPLQYANLLDQTEKIMKMVEQTKVEVWVECLNQNPIKGDILVRDHELAADWVRRMNHPQFRLAFDCYHQQRNAGNLIYGIEKFWGLYPTFHIGDVPTRNEPGTGEINFPNLVKKLKELGYDGLIGMEFRPSTTEAEAFEKVKAIFQA